MRLIKSTLLLGILTGVIFSLLYFSGGLEGLSSFWKGLMQSQWQGIGRGMLFGTSLFLEIAVIWIALQSSRQEMVSVVMAIAILLLGASLVANLYSSYFTPVPGVVAILLALVSVLIFEKTDTGSREPVLRRLFGHRLRADIFRRLVDGGLNVDFSGELHEASVLVCTIHNHVDLMESLSASNYVSLMNLYLRTASDFLVDVGGYLDECSGESLRVIFGVPLPVEGASNHACKAARAALDLVSRLEDLNRECDAHWQKRLDFRIGLNSGGMIAAAYGGARMGRFSVSGPAVEFARHLSAACAQYGCRILSGPTTYELASEKLEGRPIDLLQRAESRRRVELYEFLAAKNALSPERERSRDQFWTGVIFFRERKWQESIRAFSSARIPGIPDMALDHYLERVERARRGEDEPTPDQALLAEAV